MKKVIAESLARVYTHTLCLLNEDKKENEMIDILKKTVIKA